MFGAESVENEDKWYGGQGGKDHYALKSVFRNI